jgi:hypothetical protein
MREATPASRFARLSEPTLASQPLGQAILLTERIGAYGALLSTAGR